MPVVSGMNYYTLAEYNNIISGEAKVHPQIIHTIQDASPLLDQMPFAVCNNGRSNLTKLITKYPAGQLRGFNEGVDSEKTGAKITEDATCMVSTYSVIDAEILKQNNFSAAFCAQNDAAFQRGLAHAMAERVFQGSRALDPRGIDGLQARYNKVGNGVIDAAGTAANTLSDIWVINWGLDKVHGIFPEGGAAGLQVFDRGEQDVYDASSRRYRGFITDYMWNFGIAVEDPMQVVRIANVDNTALESNPSAVNLYQLLIKAIESLPQDPGAQCAIYMNNTCRTALRLQILAMNNVDLQYETVAERKVQVFSGIPVHRLPTEILGTYTTKVA